MDKFIYARVPTADYNGIKKMYDESQNEVLQGVLAANALFRVIKNYGILASYDLLADLEPNNFVLVKWTNGIPNYNDEIEYVFGYVKLSLVVNSPNLEFLEVNVHDLGGSVQIAMLDAGMAPIEIKVV